MPGVAGGLLSLVDTSQIIRHFWSRYGSGKPDAPLKCTETIFPLSQGHTPLAFLPRLAVRAVETVKARLSHQLLPGPLKSLCLSISQQQHRAGLAGLSSSLGQIFRNCPVGISFLVSFRELDIVRATAQVEETT